MVQAKLGSTGIRIPQLGIGTWAWGTGINGGNQIFGHDLQTGDLKPVLEAATDAGLVFIDTAAVYGLGASETIIGKLLKDVPNADRFIIATKFTPLPFYFSGKAMVNSLKKSLKRLGMQQIALYQIHSSMNIPKWTKAIIELKKEGLINGIGISNHNLEQTKRAAGILDKAGMKLDSLQNHYSPLYRVHEQSGLLKWCLANQVTFLSYMVLEQGILSGRFTPENPPTKNTRRGKVYSPEILTRVQPFIAKLRDIGIAHQGRSVAEIVIAWAIGKGTIPLVGATATPHIASFLNALSTSLDRSTIEKIDDAANQTGLVLKAFWEPKG
jgi:aryl-alcohol dehydrogenase-like predicted oxidoreductase